MKPMIPKDKKIKSRVGRRSTAATQSQSPAKPDILNRIFQNLTRQENVEQFKAKKNNYEEQSFSSGKSYLSHCQRWFALSPQKTQTRLRPISNPFYELQEDPVHQRILKTAKTFSN